MRSLTLAGLVCGTLITSWDVSRKPRPVRPPTSMKEAKRDQTTQVSAWYRFQILTIEFRPACGVLTWNLASFLSQWSFKAAKAESTFGRLEYFLRISCP